MFLDLSKMNLESRLPKDLLTKGSPLVLSVSVILGTVLAGYVAINANNLIEFGKGAVASDSCTREPITVFDQEFVGTDSKITRITIRDIPVSCEGKYLRIQLFNSSNSQLESIVWQLSKVSATDESITVIADGSTLSDSNSSISNVSLNYPESETDPLGLTLSTIDPSQIDSYEIQSFDRSVTE